MADDISAILRAGACLTDSPGHHSDLKAALLSRLARYREETKTRVAVNETSSIERIQRETALHALSVVEQAQSILAKDAADSARIGTRDLAQLRTLISIAFKWGIEPALNRIIPDWLTATPCNSSEFAHLNPFLFRMLCLPFPGGAEGGIAQTLITTTIVNGFPVDLLKPTIALGWLPKELFTEICRSMDPARLFTYRILAMYTFPTFSF